MPYLAINNYAVSCKDASTGFKEAGSRGYNQANRYFLNRAGRDKREWKFETIPLSNDDAQSLIGMLQMRGEHFPFATAAAGDGTNAGAGVARSQKGRDRTVSVATRGVPNRAADGGLVYLMGGALQTPYIDFAGNSAFPYQGALWPHKGFTNVLSGAAPNNANPEVLGDLSVYIGGALATETNRHWAGTGCVRWDPGALNQGVRAGLYALAATTRYVGSVYVKGSVANQIVEVIILENGVVIGASGDITLPASTDAWTRIWAAGTTTTGANASVGVRCRSGPSAFYVDGLQLCAVTSITNPGPWIAGTSVEVQTQLEYDNTFLRDMKDGLTINAWVYRIDSSYATYVNITNVADSTNWFRSLAGMDISNGGRARFMIDDGTDLTRTDFNYVAEATTVLNSAWHMITGTWDPSTTASPLTPAARIYVDGVLEGTDTTNAFARAVDWHDPGLFTNNITVGYRGAAGGVPDSVGALISHLSILPFTASANIIAGWYGTPAATDPPLSFFPLTCSGDFLASDERWISAFGEVTDVENIQVFDAGVWNTNYKKIKFTLTEA